MAVSITLCDCGGGGSGDVVGPASAVDGAFVLFDGITGKLIKDSGTVPTSGIKTFLATPSSVNLAAAVTDETGSGSLVFGTSPTFVTPLLGTPTSGVLTNCTGLPIAGITGLGTGVATLLAGTPSGTGGLAGTTSPTFTTKITVNGQLTLGAGSSGIFGLQCNPTSGITALSTFLFQDKTPTTGATQGVLRAGDAQSTSDLLQVQNSSSAVLSALGSDGSVRMGAGGNLWFSNSGRGINFTSNPLTDTGTANNSIQATSSGGGITLTTFGNASFTLVANTNGNTGVPMFDVRSFDGATSATTLIGIRLKATASSTPTNGLGNQILLQASSTVSMQNQAAINSIWTDVTHATRTGAIQFQTVNNAGALAEVGRFTGPGMLTFGGITSGVPALKPASTVLQARLADDSDFSFLQAKLRTHTNLTSGLVAVTVNALVNSSIILYDAVGTAITIYGTS